MVVAVARSRGSGGTAGCFGASNVSLISPVKVQATCTTYAAGSTCRSARGPRSIPGLLAQASSKASRLLDFEGLAGGARTSRRCGSGAPAAACLSIGPLLRRGPGSDKRGYVNRAPSQPGPRCAGGATFWPPSSSVRPSRRSCAPIPPSSPRPTSPGASSPAWPRTCCRPRQPPSSARKSAATWSAPPALTRRGSLRITSTVYRVAPLLAEKGDRRLRREPARGQAAEEAPGDDRRARARTARPPSPGAHGCGSPAAAGRTAAGRRRAPAPAGPRSAGPERVVRRCTPGGAVVEHVGSDHGVVAEALDAEQASVGSEADLLQIFEVPQPAADIGVVRVVDDRLGAQRAPLLVVLLDARVLVD